jgi:hypothetical protein
MPAFVAMLVASLAGWLVESPLRAAFGAVPAAIVSLVVATVAYFFAKHFLSDLRNGS